IENLDDTRLKAEGAVTMNSYNGWNKNKLEPKGLPIDHIFVSKGDFYVKNYKVCNYLLDGLFPSDHFPVIATIEVK
ncbi:MAG: endonuclease, partial [Clostridia bacterium]|nr:endonuclease [Clostridia bacterium]